MPEIKRQFLIDKAKDLMRLSEDPAHDLSHVERVVKNSKELAEKLHLSQKDVEIVELAAYWHDVARILTKKPSCVWVTLIDDLLSAIMLFAHSIRYRFWKYSGGVATRIILAKSMGASALFTKILLRPKERILLDILKDADMLDLLNIERIKKACELSQVSKKYFWGFKLVIFFNTKKSVAKMRTTTAQKNLLTNIQNLIRWIENERREKNTVYRMFGDEWMNQTSMRFTDLHRKLSESNS